MRSLFRITGIAAVAATALLSLPCVASANPSEIYMSDACSPSFNVALNDPTLCNRDGGTPFDVFIQELGSTPVLRARRTDTGLVDQYPVARR